MNPTNEEKNLIEMINRIMPKNPFRMNACFESDAEVINHNNDPFLFTMDEFSAEDMFLDNDPYILGWNVAAGAISDISACGGTPLYYGHAVVVSESWDAEFIKKFSQGIADVLSETNTAFIGGDLGKSEHWRYTATVIGTNTRPRLNRKGAKAGHSIYLSGKVGIGNLQAALKMYSHKNPFKLIAPMVKSKFALRVREGLFISDYANCCIDTSDGVFNALNTLCDLNNIGYGITDLPYITLGSLGASAIDLPKELLFLGEAGEYELLFTINPEIESDFLGHAENQDLTFYKIGTITHSGKILTEKNCTINLSNLHIRARDFSDRKEYLNHLMRYIKEYS